MIATNPKVFRKLCGSFFDFFTHFTVFVCITQVNPSFGYHYCGKPSFRFATTFEPQNDSYLHDDTVRYRCRLADWKLDGDAVRRCHDGRWTGHPPACAERLRHPKLAAIEVASEGHVTLPTSPGNANSTSEFGESPVFVPEAFRPKKCVRVVGMSKQSWRLRFDTKQSHPVSFVQLVVYVERLALDGGNDSRNFGSLAHGSLPNFGVLVPLEGHENTRKVHGCRVKRVDSKGYAHVDSDDHAHVESEGHAHLGFVRHVIFTADCDVREEQTFKELVVKTDFKVTWPLVASLCELQIYNLPLAVAPPDVPPYAHVTRIDNYHFEITCWPGYHVFVDKVWAKKVKVSYDDVHGWYPGHPHCERIRRSRDLTTPEVSVPNATQNWLLRRQRFSDDHKYNYRPEHSK